MRARVATTTSLAAALVAAACAPGTAQPPSRSARANVAAAAPATAVRPDHRAELRRALADSLERARRDNGLVGMSVAVVDHDDVAYLGGFGSTDVAGATAVTEDTPFFIASVTKSFTAVLVGMAADDGKLSFDDSPRRFFPAFHLKDPEADAHATLRDLLAHRTGLPPYAGDLVDAFDGVTLDTLVGLLPDMTPTAPFRARSQYVNLGFAIAGEAAARAEGKTYEALLGERILAPLGMTHTRLTGLSTVAADGLLVPGYMADPGHAPIAVRGWVSPSATAPAGGLRSTARDMAQWVRLQNGRGAAGGRRFVREDTFAEILKPHAQNADGTDIGLDLELETWRGHRVAWHAGAALSAHALLAFLPDDGVGFAMLSNTLPVASQDELREALLDAVFGALLPNAAAAPPADATSPAPPPSPWGALPPGSPTAEEVMAKSVAAQGGEAAMRRPTSRELVEDVTFEAHGVHARVTRIEAPPSRFVEERDVAIGGKHVGTNRHFFDGESIYLDEGASVDAPARLPLVLTRGASDANEFYGDASFRTAWTSLRLLGTSEIDGEPAYAIEEVAASGLKVILFVSTRTFLPLRRAIGSGSVTFGDYRWVNGIRVPFSRAIKNENALGDGGDAIVKVREVRFDVPVSDATFRP